MGITVTFDKADATIYTPPDLLVADLDGTLTQVGSVTAKIASVSDRWDMPTSAAAIWAYEQFKKACDAAGISERKLEDFKANMMSMLTRAHSDSHLVLSAAAESKIPCRILSNSPKKWGEYVIRSLNMDSFVQQAVFREDMEGLKPDPRSLQKILADFSTKQKKSRIWIYGDRKSDVQLAWNAAKAFPQQFLPVAVAGTKAALTIQAANDNCPDGSKFGIVFKTQYDMAKTLHPSFENKLKEYIQLRDKNYGIIDSSPSP